MLCFCLFFSQIVTWIFCLFENFEKILFFFVLSRNSSRNGAISVRFRPEIDSLSPMSFTKDQISVPRRHSSCNPGIKSTSNFNDFLGVPVNIDERRWSIAAAHDLPTKYNVSFSFFSLFFLPPWMFQSIRLIVDNTIYKARYNKKFIDNNWESLQHTTVYPSQWET